MSDIRFGVVGCGFIGSTEARIVHSHPHGRVVAVVGGQSQAGRDLAAELGCDLEPNVRSLAARADVDAVIVATPNHLHLEPVVAAARSGKHVFLEKPMALSVADCDQMCEAVSTSGITFMLGMMMHYYEGLQRMRRIVQEGSIGTPLVGFVARTGWERPQAVVSWKKQQAMSGGHLFHHIHEIDLLRWLMGEVRSVFARGRNFAHVGPGYGDEDDVILISLEFANGSFATMEYGSGFRLGRHVVTVNGSLGALHLDNAQSRILYRREGHEDTTFDLFDDPQANRSMIELFRGSDGGIAYGRPGDRPRDYLARAIERELDAFIRVLTGAAMAEEERWMFDPAQGRASVAVAEAALRSARLGQAVDLSRTEVGDR